VGATLVSETQVPDRLITIRSYSTPYEASLAKAELESFDIDATLADVDTISLNWLWSNALGGVKVQVPESEVEDALGILAAQPSDESTDGQDELGAVTCPSCGSSNTHYFLDRRGTFLTWLVLGLPVIPVVSKQACADCGGKWKA
jgi:hypothetical protein